MHSPDMRRAVRDRAVRARAVRAVHGWILFGLEKEVGFEIPVTDIIST